MSVNVNFRTDEEVKKRAEAIYRALGLNLSNALNMFLHATIQANNLPFQTQPVKTEYSEEEINNPQFDFSSALPQKTTSDGSSIVPAEWFEDDESDEFYAQWYNELKQKDRTHA